MGDRLNSASELEQLRRENERLRRELAAAARTAARREEAQAAADPTHTAGKLAASEARTTEAELRRGIAEGQAQLIASQAAVAFDHLWGRPAHDTTKRTYSEVYEGYHLDGRPIGFEEWTGARAVLKGAVVDGDEGPGDRGFGSTHCPSRLGQNRRAGSP